MTKDLDTVLRENYPAYDPLLHQLCQNDGNGTYFRRDLWPSEL